MSVGSLFINLSGLVLIILILWWFFFSKHRVDVMIGDKPIKILVKDGIYQPSSIQVPMGKEIKLHFVRQDGTPCAETVLFSKLNTSYQLPLNQNVEIIIPPQQPGEIEFTCQMGMYKGKLLVSKN
ncbi:MAG TPA: cupredoxin domain-containing protein [Gammaproteobacteria bacterium]|nr:cupredoxin domain-containing protein [Gammaproteobacteria bacterium]